MSVHYPHNTLNPTTDTFTNAPRYVTMEHSLNHNGCLFGVNVKFTLATDTFGVVAITTPPSTTGVSIHYQHESISTSADMINLEFYESPVFSGGTTITPINRNRSSAKTSIVYVVGNPTIESYGNLLGARFVGGGSGQAHYKIGGIDNDKVEWYLKSNTNYLIKVNNESNYENVVYINPVWCEEGL